MVLSDGFGGFGGIAKFNRDFLEALDASSVVQRVHALPRLIPNPIVEVMPESIVYDRRAARGKIAFLQRLGSHLWRRQPINLVICGHINLLPAAWLFAYAQGARLALIIHGLEAWTARTAWGNRIAPTVDSFIAVSRYSAEKFSAWSKTPMDRFFIIPNCVDLDHFRPGHRDPKLIERYSLKSAKVILTVGRLGYHERYKGFDEVIEALPQLIEIVPNLKYMIVGDGPDRKRLEIKAKTYGVSDCVIFTGRIPESEKVAHYNLADAYVMPSSGEGFGIVLIEAAACGIPIVGSSIDGSREALLEGRLGRLVSPDNRSELVAAVTELLLQQTHHKRIDAIDTFSTDNFRIRVSDWLNQQLPGQMPISVRGAAV
jgi:glycosyltransferase involved in cell wall biosynthesis